MTLIKSEEAWNRLRNRSNERLKNAEIRANETGGMVRAFPNRTAAARATIIRKRDR